MFKVQCAACGDSGTLGTTGSTFEIRGKYNGYPAVKCLGCGAGMYVSNAGRAMITKRAKTKLIPGDSWKQMCDSWDRMFPPTSS